MIRRLPLLATLLLSALAAAPPVGAVFKIMAYGDSITQGIPYCGPFGCAQGYPSRVRALYGCNGVNCALTNRGKSGELTTAGVTRLTTELNTNPPWDLVILMHGTNDVFNSVSNDTIEANLAEMDDKARDAGADTAHASIIWFNYEINHPGVPNPPPGKDPTVQDLRNRVSNLAASRNRYFIDQWNELCPTGNDVHGHPQVTCFGFIHWFDELHPSDEGYFMMGNRAYNTLNATPIPTAATPTFPSGTVVGNPVSFDFTKESPDRANWYQIQIDNGGNLHDKWYQENDICSGSTCSLPAPVIPGVGSYSWRVRTRNPRGHGPWSAASFYTVTSPPAPTAQTPEGEYVTGSPTYRWHAAAGATSYEVEVRKDGAVQGLSPSSPYVAGSICTGLSCSLSLSSPSLTIGPGYTWKVRGLRGDTPPGPWSAELAFSRVSCNATNPLVLQNQTITTAPAPERACVDLHTGNLGGGDYVVGNGGVVTHQAGSTLILFNGFAVETGGSYTAKADG